ncbi:MAG: hypothetical protein IKP07_02735 [Bacilli bacterium]|nr:hypothetical protein [Bacilli bacterium]
MKKNIVYVTCNKGKYYAVRDHFKEHGIEIDYASIDIDELDINDISKISLDKARKAYAIIGKPLFVADSGFYIDDYPNNPGYPGAFVKRSGISTNVEMLLDVMKDRKRSCRFIDCLTYFDGTTIKQFYGISEGELSTTVRGGDLVNAKSNLWKVFIPVNESKTLAEMSDYERNHRKDNHTSATEEFIKWLNPEVTMEENFSLLTKRVIDSLDRSDLASIRDILSKIKGATILTGSGGSSVVSLFGSKVLEEKNGIITTSLSPRDMLYKNISGYRNVISCSYSGSNYGVETTFKNDLNKYLLSTGTIEGVNNLTYVMDKERSFISLAATLTPMAILLSYYLDGNNEVIKDVLNSSLDISVRTASTYEVMSGYESSVAAKYLESTLTESGLGNCVVHDKYDYCHGRSTVGYHKDNEMIYFNGDTELDRTFLRLLEESKRRVSVIDKKYDNHIVNDFYYTYMSMLLTHQLALKEHKSLSKVDYDPTIVKKVYRYNGNM